MKKALCAALLGGCVLATPAMAADLGFSAPTSSSSLYYGAPAHTWSGLYFGVNGGYSLGSLNSDIPGLAASESLSGFSAGGQVGFDIDMGGFVIGAETDLQWSNVAFSQDFAGGGSASTSLDFFGTARARAGFGIDAFLPYVTAGVAYGRGTTQIAGPGAPAATDSQFHTGWTAGAGVEYAMGGGFSVRGEYLYTSLGESTYFAGSTPATVGMDFHTVRAGLNFRF